jgi:hypothetical protein
VETFLAKLSVALHFQMKRRFKRPKQDANSADFFDVGSRDNTTEHVEIVDFRGREYAVDLDQSENVVNSVDLVHKEQPKHVEIISDTNEDAVSTRSVELTPPPEYKVSPIRQVKQRSRIILADSGDEFDPIAYGIEQESSMREIPRSETTDTPTDTIIIHVQHHKSDAKPLRIKLFAVTLLSRTSLWTRYSRMSLVSAT